MTVHAIVDLVTGQIRRVVTAGTAVDLAANYDPSIETAVACSPDISGRSHRFDLVEAAFVALPPPPVAPPELDVEEIFALYTLPEQLRIFGSPIPEIRTLVAKLQARRTKTAIGSIEHVQGTALIAGLGLLDTPGRAAQVLAGQTPE